MEKHKVWGSVIIVAGFGVGWLLFYLLQRVDQALLGLGLMGGAVLVGVLLGTNAASKAQDFTQGQVRKAIAVSMVVVFFAFFGFAGTLTDPDAALHPVAEKLFENLWWIVGAVVTFYFGSRSAEGWAATLRSPRRGIQAAIKVHAARASELIRKDEDPQATLDRIDALLAADRALADAGL